MNLVAGVVAVLLTGSTAIVPAGAGPVPHDWQPGDHGGPIITMSIENWGEDVDLAGTAPAYALIGANGPMTHVKVEIQPPSSGMHGYFGRLTAPQAFGGELKLYCGDEFRRIDLMQRCYFDIPVSRGINHLTFDLQSASWEGIVSQEGTIHGGSIGYVSVLEAMLPYRNWQLVPSGETVAIRGEVTSALRYRIMNTGELPFRAPDSCLPDAIVWQYQQLLCQVRGPRPVFALAGDYSFPVDLVDPVGGTKSVSLDGGVRVKGLSIQPNADGRTGPGRESGARGFHLECILCTANE